VRVELCACVAAAIGVAFACLAAAADNPSAAGAVNDYRAFQVCATEADDRRRLACYDKVMQRPGSTPPTPEQRFGLTPGQQLEQQHVTAPPKEMTSQVVAVGRAGNGLLRLTLANGQVWTAQSPDEPDLSIDVGDSVTVRRGLLGSFLLTASKGGKRSMRVDRAK